MYIVYYCLLFIIAQWYSSVFFNYCYYCFHVNIITIIYYSITLLGATSLSTYAFGGIHISDLILLFYLPTAYDHQTWWKEPLIRAREIHCLI